MWKSDTGFKNWRLNKPRTLQANICSTRVLKNIEYNRILNHYNVNSLLFFQTIWVSGKPFNTSCYFEISTWYCKVFWKGELTLVISLYLSKALHTVNHDIVFSKLHTYSVKVNYLKLLKICSMSRKQCISFDQNKKRHCKVFYVVFRKDLFLAFSHSHIC